MSCFRCSLTSRIRLYLTFLAFLYAIEIAVATNNYGCYFETDDLSSDGIYCMCDQSGVFLYFEPQTRICWSWREDIIVANFDFELNATRYPYTATRSFGDSYWWPQQISFDDLVPSMQYEWKATYYVVYQDYDYNRYTCSYHYQGTLRTLACPPIEDSFQPLPNRLTGRNIRQCGEGCGYHTVYPAFQQWEDPSSTPYSICSVYTPDLECTNPGGSLAVHAGEYYRWPLILSPGYVHLLISASPLCAQPPCCCRGATCSNGSLPCANTLAEMGISIGTSKVNFTFEPGLNLTMTAKVPVSTRGNVFLRLDTYSGSPFKLNYIDVTFIAPSPTPKRPSPSKTKRPVTPSKRLVTPSRRRFTPSKRPVTPSKRLTPLKRPATPTKRLTSSRTPLLKI